MERHAAVCTHGFLPKFYELWVMKMAKIKMQTTGTIAEHYKKFLLAKQAEGVTAATLTTYRQHLSAVSKFLAIDMEIDALTKEILDKMIPEALPPVQLHVEIAGIQKRQPG